MLLQPPPPGFINHTYEFEVTVNATNESVWLWLNDPKTFIKTQYWPFRVEFYSPDPITIPNGFHEGVLTNHHGPLLNLAGEITQIKSLKYRDLQYFYGSYALGFRLIRPYRLEFWTNDLGEKTVIKCKLSSYVKPSLSSFWTTAQRFFWKSFKRWSKKAIPKLNAAKAL